MAKLEGPARWVSVEGTSGSMAKMEVDLNKFYVKRHLWTRGQVPMWFQICYDSCDWRWQMGVNE